GGFGKEGNEGGLSRPRVGGSARAPSKKTPTAFPPTAATTGTTASTQDSHGPPPQHDRKAGDLPPVLVCEAGVAPPTQVQDGGLEVMDMNRVADRPHAEIIGFAEVQPRLHAAAGHPDGERRAQVVAAQFLGRARSLEHRRPAKLAAEDD